LIHFFKRIFKQDMTTFFTCLLVLSLWNEAQCLPIRKDVNTNCLCTREFDLVCGKDGIEYSNECMARCNKAEVACSGNCPCSQPPQPLLEKKLRDSSQTNGDKVEVDISIEKISQIINSAKEEEEDDEEEASIFTQYEDIQPVEENDDIEYPTEDLQPPQPLFEKNFRDSSLTNGDNVEVDISMEKVSQKNLNGAEEEEYDEDEASIFTQYEDMQPVEENDDIEYPAEPIEEELLESQELIVEEFTTLYSARSFMPPTDNACAKCSGDKAPVCGKDGRTYHNRCLAECEGVEVDCDGECICVHQNVHFG